MSRTALIRAWFRLRLGCWGKDRGLWEIVHLATARLKPLMLEMPANNRDRELLALMRSASATGNSGLMKVAFAHLREHWKMPLTES